MAKDENPKDNPLRLVGTEGGTGSEVAAEPSFQPGPSVPTHEAPSSLPEPRVLVGAVLGVLALVAGAYFFVLNKSNKVTDEELAAITAEFPQAITRLVAQKKKDSKVNKIDITQKEVSPEGAIRFTYVLSFDETSPNGEVTTNTLNQVAVLKRKGSGWNMVSVDSQSQELTFQTGISIESGPGGGTPAPASDKM